MWSRNINSYPLAVGAILWSASHTRDPAGSDDGERKKKKAGKEDRC